MPSLRLDTACFASILFETFFFGFYTLLFVVAVRLLSVRGRVRIPWIISVPTLLLYIFAAAHVLTTIKHGSVGFIQIASQGQVDGAIKYFATTVNATNMYVY
ncbi:hypothetical protein CPB86DRAFT_716975 [Serendipita vermifera]|nr:hypothetical protein CPB86DRAFT_716975 [Serendipita vermifera]